MEKTASRIYESFLIGVSAFATTALSVFQGHPKQARVATATETTVEPAPVVEPAAPAGDGGAPEAAAAEPNTEPSALPPAAPTVTEDPPTPPPASSEDSVDFMSRGTLSDKTIDEAPRPLLVKWLTKNSHVTRDAVFIEELGATELRGKKRTTIQRSLKAYFAAGASGTEHAPSGQAPPAAATGASPPVSPPALGPKASKEVVDALLAGKTKSVVANIESCHDIPTVQAAYAVEMAEDERPKVLSALIQRVKDIDNGGTTAPPSDAEPGLDSPVLGGSGGDDDPAGLPDNDPSCERWDWTGPPVIPIEAMSKSCQENETLRGEAEQVMGFFVQTQAKRDAATVQTWQKRRGCNGICVLHDKVQIHKCITALGGTPES